LVCDKKGIVVFLQKKMEEEEIGEGERGRLFGYNLKTINGY
jgi:hypothetical protein